MAWGKILKKFEFRFWSKILLFFIRFLLIEHFLPQNTDEYKLRHQKSASMLLVFSVFVGLVTMQLIEWLMYQKLEDNLIFAHLMFCI